MFFSIPIGMEGPITIFYWLLLADTPPAFFMKLTDNTHGGVLIILFIEFALNTHPMGWKGFGYDCFTAVVYTIWNYIYSTWTVKPVYKFLT